MEDRLKFRVWCINKREYEKDLVMAAQDGGLLHDARYGYVRCKDDTHIREQCTGMEDKNDALIFEGDIVRIPRSEEYGDTVMGRVAWGGGCWMLRDKDGHAIEVWDDGTHEWYNLEKLYPEDDGEVIGNIHESPELLVNK